jgi:hypothetical protein
MVQYQNLEYILLSPYELSSILDLAACTKQLEILRAGKEEWIGI